MAEDKQKVEETYWRKWERKREKIDVIAREIYSIEKGKTNIGAKGVQKKLIIYRNLLGFNSWKDMRPEDFDNLILVLEKQLMLLYKKRAFPQVYKHFYGNES